ncbi:hypothetical protein WH95_15495 [Kiloniella litopenaei]|uniref:Pyridoxal-dependent decarboxylase n=1 Tax=Kiloniella litopenaei TaxID=1549748 RepID=A0A0M2R253_9PROT|nr:aminotransferase class V-fold PLP-dependent enzyme [Kiloniella litopenaei]KKJ75967.1 hypothetical protein WH95_15495 [Kiloniella litopenaei]
MTNDTSFLPSNIELRDLAEEVGGILQSLFHAVRPMPGGVDLLPLVPSVGEGAGALPKLWHLILENATRLDSPLMSGHMDTAPHPYAVLTQTIVSALNQNMLFRELSPFASNIEESLIELFLDRLNLGSDWGGTWASGGSIANLTALFCAVGGYDGGVERTNVHMLLPESGHASLKKAAAILGIPKSQISLIKCNDAGAIDIDALDQSLSGKAGSAHCVVTSVLGTTIHGSVDDISGISSLCQKYGAWHHVDAIYGGALMFSKSHRKLLAGLSGANSVVVGPQKWMYVPRVSAAVLISGKDDFDRKLGVSMPYSISGETHRGFWGLQGSRPADAVVLWTLLQALGTDVIGQQIDASIALTQNFYKCLLDCKTVAPAHVPDLNLQVIRPGGKLDAIEIQKNLTREGGLWTSVSQWRDQMYLRTVLLSPKLNEKHVSDFAVSLEEAAS